MKNSSMGWDKERLTELTFKYIQGELTVGEQAELEQWLNADVLNRERFEARIKEENLVRGMGVWAAARESKEMARERMEWEVGPGAVSGVDGVPGSGVGVADSGKVVRMARLGWWRVAVAAAIVVGVLGFGVMVLLFKPKVRDDSFAKVTDDLPPGGSRAVLTLANGATVVLDSAGKGLVARQGRSEVVKTDSGQLIYKEGSGVDDKESGAGAASGSEVGFNVVSTPRGGQYEVRLPDGTKVWLNASSSVRYPVAFGGERREVEMTGEVYFEVVHKADQPFVVKALGREIEDVGTHFNVNAYEDEPEMRTTLLEGAVKVGGVVLAPGQQARIGGGGGVGVMKDVDLEEVVAWKNGLFEFNGADIETVMRAIGRWYDVTINYQAEKDSHRFTGQISRSAKASEALEILATSGYHFNIQGNVITVLP